MTRCVLDINNYCERHKRIHFGSELIISQADTIDAEQYRLYWDTLVKPSSSSMQKLLNFKEALTEHIRKGAPRATDEEYEKRLQVCDTCNQCDKEVSDRWMCRACGCYLKEGALMPGKARWADQDCPLGLWLKNSFTEKKAGCGCGKNTS